MSETELEKLLAWAAHGADEARWPPGMTIVDAVLAALAASEERATKAEADKRLLQCLSEGNAMMMVALRADYDTARAELSAAQEGDYYSKQLAAAQGLIGEAAEALDAADECTWHHSECPNFRPEVFEERECDCIFCEVEPLVLKTRETLRAYLIAKAPNNVPVAQESRSAEWRTHGRANAAAEPPTSRPGDTVGNPGSSAASGRDPGSIPGGDPEPQTHAFVPSNLRGVGRCGVCGKPATDPCHTPKSPTETPDIPPRPWRYAYFGTDDWAILSTCHVAGRIETKATAQLIVDAVNAYAPPPAPESAAPTPILGTCKLTDKPHAKTSINCINWVPESAAKPTPPETPTPLLWCPWCKKAFNATAWPHPNGWEHCPLCRGSFSFDKPRTAPPADKGGR